MAETNSKIIKKIDEKHFLIDIGKEHGIEPGDEFAVYSKSEDIKHPETKEDLGPYKLFKGRIITKSVDQKMSFVILKASPYYSDIDKFKASDSVAEFNPLLINIGDSLTPITTPSIEVEISPLQLKPGGKFTTNAKFKGNLINGFFDNAIIYPLSGGTGVYWNPDPKTWDTSKDTGKLQDFVEINSKWDFVIPENSSKGDYLVSVRMYEDPYGIPQKGRYILASKDITIKVI